jgi:GNAT superfamily N-acetyltransferase
MLEIRRASEADVDSLAPLKAGLHAKHVARRPDVFKAMDRDAVAAWLRERLADDATQVWMAEERGRPMGYLLAVRREREETPFSLGRRWCEIDEVAVEASYQRRGIARALIERAAAQAQESGLDAVELTTWAFNEPAQAAFARVGFRPMIARYELSPRSPR